MLNNKAVKLALLAAIILLAVGGIFLRRQAGSAPLTTEALTALAKNTAPEDRAAWLRLARQTLAAENVASVAAPSEPLNNRSNRAAVELGHLLFFDPVLSGDQKTSCATCHHPDYGMADGLPRGVGAGGRGVGPARAGTGRELARNTPSVFNVAFSPLLFWDGRAGSLEEQALAPLFAEDEMNVGDAGGLLRRLRAIPKYRELFNQAFGFDEIADGGEVTLPNITRALAAFERKLNITETAYDHFVSGRDDQLTTEQLRGLVIFFGQGQCAVCHIPPQFHDGAVAAIGTPATAAKDAPLDADPGFGVVMRRADTVSKFKTPGLRNIERTAPYLHNGVFKTLEEVVDFYNDGGGVGRGLEVQGQDFRVTKLDLTEQQKRALVSFLKSLNDLAAPPVMPAAVASGLPVVGDLGAQAFLPAGPGKRAH